MKGRLPPAPQPGYNHRRMRFICAVGQRQSSALRQSLLSLAGRLLLACAAVCSAWPVAVTAQVPAMLNFQGRVVVRGGSFDGTGQFKLSLVNADGSSVYWRNAPDANADGEPDAFVSLPVNRGL